MKFICCSDLHIRSNAPINRKDTNYFDTVFDKFNQIIDIANQNNANILCAGDLFDHIKVSHRVVNEVINSINRLNGRFLLVMGQHDLPNHKTDFIDASPIKTLLILPNVTLLGKSPQTFGEWRIFGCSWEQKIPKLVKRNNSILVIHKSITPDVPPFFLPNAISADQMLDDNTFKIIVSGDYHESFVKYKYGKILINCGSMIRKKMNERDNRPCCYMIDTESNKIKMIELSVKEPDEVFISVKPKDQNSVFNEELKNLISSLKEKSKRPDYKQIVNVIIDQIKPKEGTITKIKELLDNADSK